ncbi:MAG: hypothetical protein JNK45_02590 [Myxococcales bacterium]|nr:hypothetical protein [Myxococcales bacterium]
MGRTRVGWALLVGLAGGCSETAQGAGGSTSSATAGGSGADTTADGTSTTSTTAGGSNATGPGPGDEACDGSSGEFELTGATSGGGSAEDTNAGMGGDIPVGLTVFAVRQDDVDAGTLVEIEDLVVTAPIVPTDFGSLVFLQAPEGGEYSAITAAIATTIDDLPMGTRVRVVGRVARLGELTQIVVDGADEDIFAEGTATLPDPFVVELVDLGDPAAVLDPYDSALIQVLTPQVLDDDVCAGEFAITAQLRVDDLFLGDLAPTPATGNQYSAIVGPLRTTGDGYEIAPRNLDDLVQ